MPKMKGSDAPVVDDESPTENSTPGDESTVDEVPADGESVDDANDTDDATADATEPVDDSGDATPAEETSPDAATPDDTEDQHTADDDAVEDSEALTVGDGSATPADPDDEAADSGAAENDPTGSGEAGGEEAEDHASPEATTSDEAEPAEDAAPAPTAMVTRSKSTQAKAPAIVRRDSQRAGSGSAPMVTKRAVPTADAPPSGDPGFAATAPPMVPGQGPMPTGPVPIPPGAPLIGPDGMPLPMGIPGAPPFPPGPGPLPIDGVPQHMAPPPGLEHDRLVKRPREVPTQGWRSVLHRSSGGMINLGKSKAEQHREAVLARVRQPIRGDYRVAVMSLKGGVGKTTVTVGLGSSFSSERGDRVIAVDANPDLGTLASRVPQQTTSTVRTLLHAGDDLTYTDIRQHTSQAPSRLEVLASERDPAVSESFTSGEYRDVLGILENFYNIIMTDCGTGLLHSAMEGVLSTANAIVLVTSPAVDGAQSASATLDWLNAHGYAHLARQAVVVISASKPGASPVDVPLLTRHFLGRTRAVHHIPYDPHLATGAIIDLDRLHRRTRDAFLELAATVADSFASTMVAPPPEPQMPPEAPPQV